MSAPSPKPAAVARKALMGEGDVLTRPFAPPDSPFPPIADYGFLSDCHTGALVASDGSVEWMCLPHFDSKSVFAAMLDRGRGQLPGGSLRGVRARRPALSPRHERDRDHLDDAAGLVARGGCADDQRLARRRPQHQPHPPADRLRRRPSARAGRRMHPGPGAGRDGVRADARLRRDAWPRGATSKTSTVTALDATRRNHRLSPLQRHAHGHRGQPRPLAPHDVRGREALLRDLLDGGAARSAHRRAGRRRGSTAPATSGARGWPKAPTPTIRGASTCSARRSR